MGPPNGPLWAPQSLGGKAGVQTLFQGSIQRPPGAVSGEWSWAGFLGGCDSERGSGAHFPFPHTALSSWNLVEMDHFERGKKDGEKEVFFSRGHCSLWHGCQGGGLHFQGIWPTISPATGVGCLYRGAAFQQRLSLTYSQPSISMGSAPTESVNQMENIWEKVPESSKKQSLNLPHTSNYFTLYLRLFTQPLHCTRYYKKSRDDLKCKENVCRLCATLYKVLEQSCIWESLGCP